MNDEPQHLARRLEADGQKTIGYFGRLTSADWNTQVYTTGSNWRVRDVMAHFVSAERSFRLLIKDVIAGGSGAPRDMDIVAFNEREVPKLADSSPEELMDAFSRARAAAVRQTQALSPQDLNKVGFHPWFGEVEVRDMLKLIYRHNMIHLRDVRKAIAQSGPVPHQDIMPPRRTSGQA